MSRPRPSERPSFAQREAYRQVLAEGYAHGRLNEQQLTRRAEVAVSAATLADLEELIADLPRGDLPVPVERGRWAAQGEELRRQRRSRAARRRPSVFIAAVLIGAIGGFAAGNIALDIRQAEAAEARSEDAQRASDDEDTGLMWPAIDPAGVFRAHAAAVEQDRVSQISISEMSSVIDVPLPADDAYDSVSLYPDGRVETEPGGTYGEGMPKALFDASTLDPEVLASMVEKAPEVFSHITGEKGNPTTRLKIRAASARQYAGVEPDAPVVHAELGPDAYGGGHGAVVWSADGERILEVYAL